MQLEDDHKLSGTPSFLGSKEASYLKSLCALKSVYFFFFPAVLASLIREWLNSSQFHFRFGQPLEDSSNSIL